MKNMTEKVQSAVYRQCQSRGYATPVDVLIDIGVLDKKKHEDWRRGRIPFLEAVCTMNLHKLSEVLKIIRKYAMDNGLKPSETDYRQWGAKSRKLRFSKTGNPAVEKSYSTHYTVNKNSKIQKKQTKVSVRPESSESGGEFAEQILSELIKEGFSGEELHKESKIRHAKIRPAVESMLEAARKAAEGIGEYSTVEEVFGSEE